MQEFAVVKCSEPPRRVIALFNFTAYGTKESRLFFETSVKPGSDGFFGSEPSQD